MMRKLAIVLVACVVVALAASGVAAAGGAPPGAGATKAPLACPWCGDVYGFAVMNTNGSGDLIVEVSLKKACPDATYCVGVWQDPCAMTCHLEYLTTNGQGNGNLHVKIPAIHSTCDSGLVEAWVCVECVDGFCIGRCWNYVTSPLVAILD